MVVFRRLLATSLLVLVGVGGAVQPRIAMAAGDVITQPQAITLSDSDAIAFAREHFPPDVAAHMLHRYIPSATASPAGEAVPAVTYSNWAGYYVNEAGTGRAVSSADAYFVVQQTSSMKSDAGAWVGVGGTSNTKLIQTGADFTDLKAFYQLYPQQSAQLLFSVAAGDTMFAATTLNTSSGYWYIVVEDINTNTYYGGAFSFIPDRSTADFIVDTPDALYNPNLIPPLSYSGAFWTYASSTGLLLTSPLGTLVPKKSVPMQDRKSVV